MVRVRALFLCIRVNSCADLFVPVCTSRTYIYAHVKDPVSICHKRVGHTAYTRLGMN